MNRKKIIYNKFKIIFAYPLILLIKLYQIILSPYIGRSCRFVPSCSHYGIEAMQNFGPFRGSILTIWRIIRCNPWGGSGGRPSVTCCARLLFSVPPAGHKAVWPLPNGRTRLCGKRCCRSQRTWVPVFAPSSPTSASGLGGVSRLSPCRRKSK